MPSSEHSYDVKWSDLDPIGHVRASVYVDITTDARIRTLAAVGYSVEQMMVLGFGPVILRSEARYHREARAGDTLIVTVEPTALSEDGSHWIIRHRVSRADGVKLATLTVQGTWLNLRQRRPTTPQPEMLVAFRELAGGRNLKQLRSLSPQAAPRDQDQLEGGEQ